MVMVLALLFLWKQAGTFRGVKIEKVGFISEAPSLFPGACFSLWPLVSIDEVESGS